MDPDHVHSSAAGAEGFHEGGIVNARRLLGDEEVKLRTDDVGRVLCFPWLRGVGGEDAHADVELGVQKKAPELVEGDSDAGRSREALDYLRIVPDAVPGRSFSGQTNPPSLPLQAKAGHRRFFAKARPDGLFRYRSKANARSLSMNA